MGVEAAIYTRLNGYTALTSLLSVSNAIYPVVAGQGATEPYLVSTVVDGDTNKAMGANVNPSDTLMDVAVISNDMDACIDIAKQVKNALDRYSGTSSGTVIQHIFYEGENDVFDPDKKYFQRTLDFRVHYEE